VIIYTWCLYTHTHLQRRSYEFIYMHSRIHTIYIYYLLAYYLIIIHTCTSLSHLSYIYTYPCTVRLYIYTSHHTPFSILNMAAKPFTHTYIIHTNLYVHAITHPFSWNCTSTWVHIHDDLHLYPINIHTLNTYTSITVDCNLHIYIHSSAPTYNCVHMD